MLIVLIIHYQVIYKLSTFDNYTGSASSTFGTIITNINNINNTLPSYLQTTNFDSYTGSASSTFWNYYCKHK
jgi:hypothetical protein